MRKFIYFLCSVLLLLLVSVVCDARLKTVYYTVDSEKINSNVRLVLITDLHSCKYGKNQQKLLDAIAEQKPDVVLLGGDIFDDKMKLTHAKEFIAGIGGKYPCFYVTGNHEYWSREVDGICEFISDNGITVLSGECETLTLNGQRLNICGVDDPDSEVYGAKNAGFTGQLRAASEKAQEGAFTVLLTHRPEKVKQYEKYDFNLVLSGHAHGGQWRIPGILNGLIAPDQGLFPKYAGGRYELEESTMIVSRGLARESTLVPRIFNRPELVVIDLK